MRNGATISKEERIASISRRSFIKGAGTTAIAVAGMGALAGCSSASEEKASSSDSSSASTSSATYTLNPETEELTVAVLGKDVKIAALIVASEEGFFEEEGVKVGFETIANFSDGITALSENRMDILPFGSIPTCTFVSQGVENLCVFDGTIAEGSECLVLPENKDKFVKLEDFDNAKCAYFPMETGHLVMQGLQQEAGTYNPDNWVIMSDQNSIMQAVLKGECDCGFVNSGQGYVGMQQGLVTSMQVGSLEPDFPCCRQTANMNNIENNTSALCKFMIAELRGQEFLESNKEKAIADLANYSGQSAEYIENVIYGTAEYDTPMIIEMDPYTDAVCAFYETMKVTGNIDASTTYEIEDHIDSSIYKFALDTMVERGENDSFYKKLLTSHEKHNTTGK